MSTGLYGKRRGISLHFQAFSILLIGLLTLGFTSAGATLARGAEISPQIFDQRLDRTEAAGGQPIRFDFKWAVPATAQAGDTFTIQLPNELRVRNSAGFPLLAPDGQTAANAVWSYKTVTFTLTDYVNSNDNVNGSAFFTLEWDSAHVDMSAGAEHMLQFSGSNLWQMPLTLIPDGTPGTGQSLSKVGWWLSGDQGASSMENQLGWVVYLDTGDEQGADTPVIITDTPGSGYQIDLDSVEGFSNGNPLSASRFTAERVGSNGVKIVLVGNYPGEPAVYPGENVYFKYDGDLLPGENGIFTNSATITEGSDDPRIVEAEILRDGAGGDGSGDGRRLTPVAPAVEQAKCTDDGTVTGPSLTLAETGGISYTVVGDIEAGESIHIIATPAKNFTLAETTGWTLNEDGTATFEVVLTTPECETLPSVEDKKAAPDAPEVVQATCNADGTVTDPTVEVAETEGVAYTVDGEVKAGNTVTVTATAKDGYKLSEAKGWTLNDDGTATIELGLESPDCETLPPVEDKETAPVAPVVEQATCNADGSVVDPNLNLATTEGVSYTVNGEVKAGNTVTVTATAQDGFKLTAAGDWTLNEDGTASLTVVLDETDCVVPPVEAAPVAPTVEQATCNADGTVTDPTVEVAETEGVAYTVDGEVKVGNTVTVTATAKDGYKLSEAKGWTLNDDGTATIELGLESPDCETLPPVEDKETAPVAPVVEQATCNADGSVVDPNLNLATTEGVAYTVDGEVKAGNTVTVTATAQDGFKLTAAGDWTLNEDGTASLTVVLDETDCVVPPVEAAPVAPTVEQATCNADGTVTDPTVEVAETEGVAYTVNGEVKAGNTVTVTATAKDGYKLSEAKGWTLNDDGTATIELGLESPDCETLPPVEDKETAPVAPVVEQATCNADGSVVDPNLNLATTEGVAYTVNGEVKAGNTVTVTATAQDGFKLTAAGDWTLNEDGTATFTVTFEEAVQCAAPTAPVTPDVDEPSEPAPSPNSNDNGQTPDESKPLANTGFSTGLVALAGALVMGAGLLVLKLRRETSK